MKLYIKTFEAKSYLRGLETTNAFLTRSLQVVMSPATQKIWKANIKYTKHVKLQWKWLYKIDFTHFQRR